MSAIRWKDEYEVEVPEIDEQHRHLVGVYNRLHLAVDQQLGQTAVGRVLVELVRYIDVHFKTEEMLMVESGYPDYASHCAQHRHFASKTASFVEDYQAGNVSGQDLVGFLRGWVLHHIAVADKKCGPFVLEARRRREAAKKAERKKWSNPRK